MVDIQTAHEKVGSRDENSREHEFKVPKKYFSEIKEVNILKQLWSVLGSGSSFK